MYLFYMLYKWVLISTSNTLKVPLLFPPFFCLFIFCGLVFNLIPLSHSVKIGVLLGNFNPCWQVDSHGNCFFMGCVLVLPCLLLQTNLLFMSQIGSSSFESQKMDRPSISVTSPMSPGMLRDAPQFLSGQISVCKNILSLQPYHWNCSKAF